MKIFKKLMVFIMCIFIFCSCSAADPNNSDVAPTPDLNPVSENRQVPEYDAEFKMTDEYILNAEIATQAVVAASDKNLFDRLDTMQFPDGDVYRFFYRVYMYSADKQPTLLLPDWYDENDILYISLENARKAASDIYGKTDWFINEKFNAETQQYELPLAVGHYIDYNVGNIHSTTDGNIITVNFDLMENDTSDGWSTSYYKTGTGSFEYICYDGGIILKSCSYILD